MQTGVGVKDLAHAIGTQVILKGWVANVRSSGSIVFLQLRDGSGIAQCVVVKNDVNDATWQNAQKINLETSLAITGTVSKHPKKEEYEVQVSSIELIQIAAEYPIGKKEHGVDFLMDNRHLWLRSGRQGIIQKIRHTIIYAIYEFMEQNGFTKIDSPIFTPNACEGTTTLFEVPYFDETAYLSQSGQLYLEAAMFGVGRCFDFGPVFRSEKSKTRRHLTEFWMMDAEAPFVEHEENMKIQEALIAFIVAKVLEKHTDDLMKLERNPEPLTKIIAPFERMTHTEAVRKLQELGSDIQDGADLGADDETMLTQQFDKPLFVEKYPTPIKAFYMQPDRENPGYALCNDMLAPEGYGEIIGGSQRIADYDLLLARIKEHNLPVDQFQWYLDLRKYGSVPHSGFGIGLERIVAWVCGLKHVRETIPFPRMITRLRP